MTAPIDRRRPVESGHGHVRTLTSPGAGIVEIRDGHGGVARISRGDLLGLAQILIRDYCYLDREARR